MLLQAASTRQIPAVMHPVAAVKQRAFMMVAYFGYLVATFANVPPQGGVALGPVFAGRRIHHPDNDCPSSSATTAADSPAVPHVFVSAAQPYRNGSETMAAFGRFLPFVTGRNWPVAAWQGYTPARCHLLLTCRPCFAQGQGCRRHLSCILCTLCFSATDMSSSVGHLMRSWVTA